MANNVIQYATKTKLRLPSQQFNLKCSLQCYMAIQTMHAIRHILYIAVTLDHCYYFVLVSAKWWAIKAKLLLQKFLISKANFIFTF